MKGSKGEPIGRGQISAESLKQMRTSHWDIMGERMYGLGTMLYIGIDKGQDIFGHDGKSTPAINTALRINPNTGDGIIVLETGNPDLATRLASDWVLSITGKTDTLLFVRLLPTMTRMMAVGIALIISLLVVVGIRRKKRSF